jgi:hypothetical protein
MGQCSSRTSCSKGGVVTWVLWAKAATVAAAIVAAARVRGEVA